MLARAGGAANNVAPGSGLVKDLDHWAGPTYGSYRSQDIMPFWVQASIQHPVVGPILGQKKSSRNVRQKAAPVVPSSLGQIAHLPAQYASDMFVRLWYRCPCRAPATRAGE